MTERTIVRDATFSPDRVYRYTLRRQWFPKGGRGFVLWIMLNPSTADAEIDDPTIRRCMSFTQSWGYDGMTVVNLFALRSTDPKALLDHPDPVGEANDEIIRTFLEAPRLGLAVAAWGAAGAFRGRYGAVVTMAMRANRALHVLGLTAGGHPKHPLYVKGDVQPAEWVAAR